MGNPTCAREEGLDSTVYRVRQVILGHITDRYYINNLLTQQLHSYTSIRMQEATHYHEWFLRMF
jgi:hypothetical protein